MSYYDDMTKAKTRIRTIFLPLVENGETVDLEQIFYDLDKIGLSYSEKGIIKYVNRACNIEGYNFDGERISK